MATATRQVDAKQSSAPKSKRRLDTPKLRHQVHQLLRLNLGKFESLLNQKLLSQLEAEFATWISTQQQQISQQVKRVPRQKRGQWLDDRLFNDRRDPENQPSRLLSNFLFQFAQQKLRQLDQLKQENQRFRKTISKVRYEAERTTILLHYAASLGASPRTLRGDKKAIQRWFDEEAVTDRYVKRVGEVELLLAFTFQRLGLTLANVFSLSVQQHFIEHPVENGETQLALRQRIIALWKRLNLESRLQDALVYEGDSRVYVSALHCLATILKEIPDGLMDDLFEIRTLMFIHRAAMECNSDVWIQCEAINILAAISNTHALPILQMRLINPLEGDDIFVRRHALKIMEQYLLKSPNNEFDLVNNLNDPSPFVRQKIAKVAFLSTHPDSYKKWKSLAIDDEDPKVRAAAILCPAETNRPPLAQYEALQVLLTSLKNEQDPFVLRTALLSSVTILKRFIAAHPESNEHQARDSIVSLFQDNLIPAIQQLQSTHEYVPVRRWAGQTQEQIWAILDPEANRMIKEIGPELKKIRLGRSKRFPKQYFQHLSQEKLGRILAVVSQDDFGYDVQQGWFGVRISRGPSFGFRFWRWFHEFTHLATDKRQGFSHTSGRISTATRRAPSQILGELSETRVPGEPLTIASDGTWRPFLPLVDDLISILNLSWFWPRKVCFHSSQGITEIVGPKRIWNRVRAAFKLNFRFKRFAELRNWDQDGHAANSYIEAVRRLGFEINFRPYASDSNADSQEETGDSSVRQFFTAITIPACTPLIGQSIFESPFWRQIQRFVDYFGSAFENSLEQLVVFASLVLLFVIGKHLYSNFVFRKARRHIPISIGGWGTRGKSGTERLKAALIGVLGHGLVSKTTGCEAMFIHSHPFGEPMEIPLFRPYDKATIWEHRNLIVLASKMNPSVFLWECMALNPDYVDVLQRQWTRDEIATITNTYPDHEDIQGPAGHNVATTIAGFVPYQSHLITTEQTMRPYVEESCRLAGTTFQGVGWLESGLITDDILERFPYREHPDNIALVAELAAQLGVDYEFSLKAMADYLVPDLGVLQTHTPSKVRTRTIEFTNGMSANERFGCMGNWKRLGFDTQDPWSDPCTWISGVVNNRADRVPRSKVFAKIIVEDINADRFYLIGNNLKGLQGFIEEAWQEHESSLTLVNHEGVWNTKYALASLEQAARLFRQPTTESQIAAKTKAMLSASLQSSERQNQIDAEDLATQWRNPQHLTSQLESKGIPAQQITLLNDHLKDFTTALNEYNELRSMIETAAGADFEKTELAFRTTLKKWFFRKFIIIEDYHATGEEVVRKIVDTTPPGFKNQLMGLQNIKGTGLDFVYRFQVWELCQEACRLALSNQPAEAERGLQTLVSMPEIGQLCQEKVEATLQQAKRNPVLQRADLQTMIDQIEAKLDKTTQRNSSVPVPKGKSTDWNRWILKTAEEFLDVNDSIRRRDLADVIYKDLAHQRISRQRAVIELRKINKRQKGGWLTDKKRAS